MNAGELTAYMDVDLGRFDRGIDQAETKGKQFERKTWTSKVDVDTTLAQSKLGALGSAIAQNSARLRSAGATMTMAATVPILALDAVAVSAASSLNEAQNKVNVVFGESSDVILKWGENAAESIGQSERQALSAAGTFGNLFVSMGMADDVSADMSVSLVNLASDLASFNDIDPTEALDALRSGLVGETEPMRRLGVNMNEATLRAKALEMGLDATGATLDPLVKAQAAYALIMEQTATAQGDFARTSDEVANASRGVKADAEDMAASFGEELLPVVKDVLGVAKPMLGFFKDLPGPVKTATIVVGGLFAVIGPSLWMLGAMADGIKAVRDAWGWIRTSKTVTDTAAITANTAAVEANTIARGKNALAPPVGGGAGGYLSKSRQLASSTPQAAAPALAGSATSTAALGGFGTAASAAAIASSVAVGAAMTYYALTYQQAPDSPNAANVTGGSAGVGRAGAASQAAHAEDIRPKLDRNIEGIAKLNAIVDEINALTPTAQNVGATKVYEGKLKRLAEQYPEIAGQIHAAAEKLREGSKGFEEAAKLAKEAAAANRDAIMSQLENVQSLVDMIATATNAELAALQALPGGIASMMSELSGAGAREKADKMLKDRYKNGIDWSQVPDRVTGYASGGEFVTNGPELILVGDNPSGKERVTVTPSEAGAGQSGVHVTNKVYASFIDMPTQSQLDRLGDALGQRTVEKVLDALAVN